jgi:hypothetical protein
MFLKYFKKFLYRKQLLEARLIFNKIKKAKKGETKLIKIFDDYFNIKKK